MFTGHLVMDHLSLVEGGQMFLEPISVHRQLIHAVAQAAGLPVRALALSFILEVLCTFTHTEATMKEL